MKKLFYFIAALSLFACEKAEDFDQPTLDGTVNGTGLPEVIYASMADENDTTATRTYADGKTILWHGGDAISYIGPNSFRAKYQYDGDDGVPSAEFTYKEDGNVPSNGVQPAIPFAVYPYSSGAYCKKVNGVNTLVVNFPTEQTYAPNSFGREANMMVGVGESANDNDFYFSNACGYLVIKLYGTNVAVKTIDLIALGGEKLSGTGYITASYDAAPIVTMDNKAMSTVTLSCGEDGVMLSDDVQNPTEFWFALPPVTFNQGFKIHVTPTQGLAFEMQTSKQVKITRNEIQPMAALEFTPNAMSVRQLHYTRKDNNQTPLDRFTVGNNTSFSATITAHYYDEVTKRIVIEFDQPLTTINKNAFRGENVYCDVLEGYKKPTAVTDITSVFFPESLTTISDCAFAGTALTSLTIPGNVTLIDWFAFWECRDLESITILEGKEQLKIVAGSYATYRNMFGFSKLSHISLNRDIDYLNEKYEPFDYSQNVRGVFMVSADYAGWKPTITETTVEIGPKVTKILPNMFSFSPIKKLRIPATVNTIEQDGLCCLNELEEIEFEESPNSLNIGSCYSYSYFSSPKEVGTFYDSEKLKKVTINRDLNYLLSATEINDDKFGMFANKSQLTDLTIGNQVTTISDYMFYNCPQLTLQGTSESVISIGKGAFAHCTSIQSFAIGGGVNTIGKDAFLGCTSLRELTFKPSPTSQSLTLSQSVVSGSDLSPFYQSPLQTVSLDRKIVKSGYSGGLFGYQKNLTSITLGSQVETLEPFMFFHAGIASITIPNTVKSIGYNAFQECTKLSTVNIEDGTQPLAIGYQRINVMDITYSEYSPFYDSPLANIYLGRELAYKDAAGNAFTPDEADEGIFHTGEYDEVEKVTVTIGSNVKTIHPYMFNLLRIKEIELPNGVETIGNRAFEDCYKLTSVTIPGSVTEIGNNVFDDCTSLSSVTFESGSEVLVMGYCPNTDNVGPFYYSPLSYIYLDREIVPANDYKNKLKDWDMGVFTNGFYKDSELTATVTIGSNVKTILDWMFCCVRMKSVEIPASVTSIGKQAFAWDYILENVTCRGTTAPTLGEDVFQACDKLKSITIPAGGSVLNDYKSKWSQYIDKLRQ